MAQHGLLHLARSRPDYVLEQELDPGFARRVVRHTVILTQHVAQYSIDRVRADRFVGTLTQPTGEKYPVLERRLERLGLTGKEERFAERYLLCDHVVDPPTAKSRRRFEATSRFVRDLIAFRWVKKTRKVREKEGSKRIRYLSMESDLTSYAEAIPAWPKAYADREKVGAHVDHERGSFGKVFERPHDSGIRGAHLESQAEPGRAGCRIDASET